MNATDTRYVQMAVPEPLVPHVTELLHDYFTATETEKALPQSDTGEGEDEQAVAVPGNGTWTRADLAAMYASFRNPHGRAVIAKIAQRSLDGETAAYGELAEHAGLNFNQLRAQFAWFSKKGKALKGTEKGVWPMTVTDAGSKAPKGVRYRYQMPKQIAAWWVELDHDD